MKCPFPIFTLNLYILKSEILRHIKNFVKKMFKFNFFEEPLEKDIQNCSYEKEVSVFPLFFSFFIFSNDLKLLCKNLRIILNLRK